MVTGLLRERPVQSVSCLDSYPRRQNRKLSYTLEATTLAANENSVFDIKMELWIINHFSKWQTHWINLWINLQLRFSRFWSELLFCKRWAYLHVLLPKATSCDVCICFPCHEFWSLSDDTYISRICGISVCKLVCAYPISISIDLYLECVSIFSLRAHLDASGKTCVLSNGLPWDTV